MYEWKFSLISMPYQCSSPRWKITMYVHFMHWLMTDPYDHPWCRTYIPLPSITPHIYTIARPNPAVQLPLSHETLLLKAKWLLPARILILNSNSIMYSHPAHNNYACLAAIRPSDVRGITTLPYSVHSLQLFGYSSRDSKRYWTSSDQTWSSDRCPYFVQFCPQVFEDLQHWHAPGWLLGKSLRHPWSFHHHHTLAPTCWLSEH